MKFIPLSGYVTDSTATDGRRKVAGFAFQISGFEDVHTWATPFLGWTSGKTHRGEWVVSHWETGLVLNAVLTRAKTKTAAAARAEAMLREIGYKRVRAVLKEWA